MYQVQIIDHEYYEQLAVEQQTRDDGDRFRGTIFDANGNVLAISATRERSTSVRMRWSLWGGPGFDRNRFVEILDVDYDKIIEKTKDTSSWYKTIRTKIESIWPMKSARSSQKTI
jgi:stage V sporulation protein D (sporulation-specific penicillin-binding protein)